MLLLHTEQDPGQALKYLTCYDGDFAYGFFLPRKKPHIFVSELEALPESANVVYAHLSRQGQIKELIKKHKIKTLGLCYNELSKRTYDKLKKALRGVKFVDVSKTISAKRTIKTDAQIRTISKAVRITEKLFEEVKMQLITATHEIDVEIYLRKRMIELGVTPSFDPIIATGVHSKHPHYHASSQSKVLEGFCIIDMGVKVDAYCSDMSRTVYIGTPSDKEKKQYNTVKDELYRLEREMKAGQKKIDVNFDMVHALGHGIGREVHEFPLLGYEKLKENMCIAVEPAQYFSAGGIRIEDNYVVTKNGLKRIGKSSRELETIKRKKLVL